MDAPPIPVLKKLARSVRKFFLLVFPSTTAEFLVFGICMLFYGTLASVIAVNYRIIFDNRIPWDAYFSFDNRAIVMTGGGFERHPLSNYFFDQIRHFALWVSGNRFNADFRLVLAWFSVITVSLSVVLIYKYLRNIIRLPLLISSLLICFFGLFSTTVLLSFTPETYTNTMFLLILFNYYAAGKIQNGGTTSFASVTLAGVAVGGLTITNIVKVFIPVLFEKNTFRNIRSFSVAASKVALSASVFVFLFLLRLNFDVQKIFAKTEQQYEKFSNPKVTPIWDMIVSWFFGGNMLFPGFIMRDYHNRKGFEYKAIFMDTYTGFFSYAFVGAVFLLLIWSVSRNFRNKMVQILVVSFLVDIIIHCVLKFGLHTSYIYGGHFIFVVPLIVGWLFHSFRHSAKVLTVLFIMMVWLTFYLGANNLWRMQEFFSFLKIYYS